MRPTRALALAAEGVTAPERIAAALADNKALRISLRFPEALVLGADQVLAFDDDSMLDKAADLAAAADHLRLLRGCSHRLISAAALARKGVIVWRAADTARTDDARVQRYVSRSLSRHRRCRHSGVGRRVPSRRARARSCSRRSRGIITPCAGCRCGRYWPNCARVAFSPCDLRAGMSGTRPFRLGLTGIHRDGKIDRRSDVRARTHPRVRCGCGGSGASGSRRCRVARNRGRVPGSRRQRRAGPCGARRARIRRCCRASPAGSRSYTRALPTPARDFSRAMRGRAGWCSTYRCCSRRGATPIAMRSRLSRAGAGPARAGPRAAGDGPGPACRCPGRAMARCHQTRTRRFHHPDRTWPPGDTRRRARARPRARSRPPPARRVFLSRVHC